MPRTQEELELSVSDVDVIIVTILGIFASIGALPFLIVSPWDDPADDADRTRWVRDNADAIAPHSEAGGYVNFMAADDQGRVTDTYGRSYARLVEVKRRYDPDNLFHHNHNIKP